MADGKMKVDVNCTGPVWFIGWLFTVAFAELGLLQAVAGVLIWPWYLGVALR